MRLYLALATLCVATACTSNAYLKTVGAFGDQVEKNITARSALIEDINQAEFDKTLAQLAQDRTGLGLSSGCTSFIAAGIVAPEVKPDCAIVTVANAAKGTQSEAVTYGLEIKNTQRLAAALGKYAGSLKALAGVGASEEEALTDGYAGLGKSIVDLNAAVGEFSDKSLVNDERTGIIAGLIGELQVAIFDYERSRLLRRLIVETDPAVQEATAFLQTSTEAGALKFNTTLYQRAVAATRKAQNDAANPQVSKANLEKSQRAAFKAVETLKSQSRPLAKFSDIAEAHSKLAAASKSGDLESLRSALSKILTLNDTVSTAIKDL